MQNSTKKGLTISDLERRIADQVIEMMEKDGLKWTKRWASVRPACNGQSGRPYSGGNVLTTALSMMVNGYQDPRFLTFKQARFIGANVRKGEKGTPIVFYGIGKNENEDTGEERRYRFGKIFYVFNIDQLDEVDEAALVAISDVTPPSDPAQRDKKLDTWISDTKAQIVHGFNQAAYTPQLDKIMMPNIDAFLPGDGATREEHYYSTLLHELVHWTGAKSRLDRLEPGGPLSASYAFEELVAELGSVMLGMQHGVQIEPREDNAAYLKGWLSKLKSDPHHLFDAAAKAGRAQSYLNDITGANEAVGSEAA